jgi:hypothetical protein
MGKTESPYTRSHLILSRLILGVTLFSESPYTLSHLILRVALYSVSPYDRGRLILEVALYSELIRNFLPVLSCFIQSYEAFPVTQHINQSASG